MKNVLTFILALAQSYYCFSQSSIDSLYLGKAFPGSAPVVFLAGITERIAISSDGKEIFFNTSSGLSYYHYSEDGWGSPKVLFSGYFQPSLSIDDSFLYVQNNQSNSYYSKKSASGWETPVVLWNTNSSKKHHLQITNSGNFYANTLTTQISSRGDISKVIINDTNISFEALPSPVNSSVNGVDFFMAKDESYIIFPEIIGGAGDLYISYKKTDTTWTNPQSLGSAINTSDWEYGPYVSPDNKYLFFSRSSAKSTYWVKIDDIINSLKPTSVHISNEPCVQIFPNPTMDFISIAFGSIQYKMAIVDIFDISGRLIKTHTYHNLTTATIDLTSNPKGIYILKISIDGEKLNKKICLQ